MKQCPCLYLCFVDSTNHGITMHFDFSVVDEVQTVLKAGHIQLKIKYDSWSASVTSVSRLPMKKGPLAATPD